MKIGSHRRQSQTPMTPQSSASQANAPAQQSNSEAQEELPEAAVEETGPASLLDQQDQIVAAFGVALQSCATGLIPSGMPAFGGAMLPGSVNLARSAVTEMFVALLAEGVEPVRAQSIANALGGQLQNYFDMLVPGQAFVPTHADMPGPATPIPVAPGAWTSASPVLPFVGLMPLTMNPQDATTVGDAIQAKFGIWESTAFLSTTGVEMQGGVIQPTTITVMGGIWN
jgi:hypothetical protein